VNTFATLLLAFPFYLAIKGKLSTYIALAKPDASSSAATASTATSSPTANGMTMAPTTGNATAAASNAVASSTSDFNSTVANVSHIFANVATIADLA
jgi:hypothetical protein